MEAILDLLSRTLGHMSAKEISVTERQDSEPYSIHQTSPQSNPVLWINKGKQITLYRSGGLLDQIKGVANSFFQDNSSFDRGEIGGRRKYRGHRRGYRGGRVKH